MKRGSKQDLNRSLQGMTLVELMIGLTLGSLLMLIIGQIYVANRQSQKLIDAQGRSQEDLRYAAEAIRRTVGMAGFRVDPAQAATSAFATTPLLEVALASASGKLSVPGTPGKEIADIVPNSEVLLLRFQGGADGAMKDCSNRVVEAEQWATVALFIDTKPENSLRCWAWHAQVGNSNPAANSAAVVPNATAFNVSLGVDDNGDSIPNRFVAAGAAIDPQQIVALRVVMTIEGNYLITETGEYVETVLDETFSIRNRAP